MPAPNPINGADGEQTLTGTGAADLIYGFDPDGSSAQANSIQAVRVTAGLTQPLFVTAAPDDPNRIFVVEKTGRIKIVDVTAAETGVFQVKATPFLDVAAEINITGEGGLLGLAFDPNYAQNGFFYVNLINIAGDTEIRRYQVSADPDLANGASAQLVLTVDQPAATNHKAGWLGFGPDGYLYAALGDGGSTPASAQDLDSLLGKVLRLDVQGDDFPGDPARNYAIPSDNPFVGVAGADEIWAYGLRNPWRDSFDRATGQLFIADVGQSTWEEIDLGARGANYGWPQSEGPAGNTTGVTLPIFSYGRSVGQSITGGYVYRGPDEQLHGQYFYGDFSAGFVATLRLVDGQWVSTDRTSQISYDVGAINNPSSFGEDMLGNLYVADIADGEIFRLTPVGVSLDGADVITGGAGDDLIFAGAGDDNVSGEADNDTLFGMDGNDTLAGGDGNDRLVGGAGDDTLDGGPGVDFLLGGLGDDTYVVDVAGDRVIENAGGGYDTVQAAINYTLLPDFEQLRLIGEDDLLGFGNALDNTLIGNAGHSTLTGGPGSDLVLGPLGVTTVAFSGNRADYGILFDTDTLYFTVTDLRIGSPDDTDRVNGVEFFRFADGTVEANAFTAQTVFHPDGSRTVTTLDAAGSEPWWVQALTYDAANTLTKELFELDNGARWTNDYDPANAFSWTWSTSHVDGLGNLVSQVRLSDDGTRTLMVFDNAEQDWAQFTVTFDADWMQTAQSGLRDDGGAMSAGEISAQYDTALWFAHPIVPHQDLMI
jgi:Ca2+-binding RTX toxin-like protein